ncbi:hypothetical protein TRIUR3_09469 [Triticum urartu]|uniref:Uncharacterized protein n=1 Tax=Triticum urartu TaxID=4572 RepID=M8A4N5_TRIUA|nr:hypothetical protein TRIUR3_09469 [Triticum urartu]
MAALATADGWRDWIRSTVATQPTLDLVEADGKCRMGGAVDVFAPLQLNLNTLCDMSSLSPPDSEQSTSKDDPQAPGWTWRVLVGQAPAPCSGRVCALEKTMRGLAEKKTDTVVGC